MASDFSAEGSPAYGGPLEVEHMAMAAFMVGLLGLILPVIPAIAALIMANVATNRIRDSHGLVGGMNWVRGAQIMALLNFAILAGIAAAAWYLSKG